MEEQDLQQRQGLLYKKQFRNENLVNAHCKATSCSFHCLSGDSGSRAL